MIGENTKTEKYKEYLRSYNDDIPVSFIKSFSKITLKAGEEVAHYSTCKTYVIPLSGGIELDENNVLVSEEYWELNESQKDIKNASSDFETTFFIIELNLPPRDYSKIRKITVNPLQPGTYLNPSFGFYTYMENHSLLSSYFSDCFIYVIEGNFEMEERFIKKGDILILENIKSIDFECLSEKGLFLLLKI